MQHRSPRKSQRAVSEKVREPNPPSEAGIHPQAGVGRGAEVEHCVAPILQNPLEQRGDSRRGPFDWPRSRLVRRPGGGKRRTLSPAQPVHLVDSYVETAAAASLVPFPLSGDASSGFDGP